MVRSPIEYSRKNFNVCISIAQNDVLKIYVPKYFEIRGKTFAVQGKSVKTAKVLSLKPFVLYGMFIYDVQKRECHSHNTCTTIYDHSQMP